MCLDGGVPTGIGSPTHPDIPPIQGHDGGGPATLHVPRRAAHAHVSSAGRATIFEFQGRLRDGP